MLATRHRIQASIFWGLMCALGAAAGVDYHALIIRSIEPVDSVLVERFSINDKETLYRLTLEDALTKDQYRRLPRFTFAGIHLLRVANGLLEVHAEGGERFVALPENFKIWPRGSLDPAVVTQRSKLQGRLPGTNRIFQAVLVEGWVVYLFPQRPGEDDVAFSLAEVQNTEAVWTDFLQRYPASAHASAARDFLAASYLARADQALARFQAALREKKPGYSNLEEARQWTDKAGSLNVQTPALAESQEKLAAFETDIADRLRQARLSAEKADFAGAQETLEPLQHFRQEFPELAAELDAIPLKAARHHLGLAREKLDQSQFDDATRELGIAASHRQLPEIAALRKEITEQRLAQERQREIQQVSSQARAAVEKNDLAVALDLLWPFATRYPDEPELQAQFASVRRLYRQVLLDQIPELEKLHTPIQGPADEEMLLKLQRDMARSATPEESPELAVWRDRLGLHLADFYRQRATETAGKSGVAFNALSFAYLQQAHHFLLDKSELAEFNDWRDRLDEELGVRVALNFRDLTPGANGQFVVAELSAQLGAVLQQAGFPHVKILEPGPGEAAQHSVELIVELLHVGVREEKQPESVQSEYSAGLRQVPTPEWQEAKARLDQATESYERVHTRADENRRQRKYSRRQRAADDRELARAEVAVNQAQEALDAAPAPTEEDDVRAYEFTRSSLVRTAEIRVAYRWVDTLAGVREAQEILKAEQSDRGVEQAGVHAADKNGHRNQTAALAAAETLQGPALRNIQQQLANRALQQLTSFIERDFERARQAVEQGQPESAAEHYLRFLFNSAPEDARRQQAFLFLRDQFRFVSLAEWLAVPAERY